MFNQALVIGLGLIGGSTALALRERNIALSVTGFDPAAGEAAKQLGLVDALSHDLAQACAASDLIILATPPTQFNEVIAVCAQRLNTNALLVDVGSTKLPFVELLKQLPAGFASRCVPCHPIAGSEKSGPAAANANLFKGARVVVCPHQNNSADAIHMAELLWAAMGAQTMRMTPQEHDAVFAHVSHLPHIVAFALAGALANQPNAQQLLEQGGAGMRDTSRIAASDAVLWADIALSNRTELLKALKHYQQSLEQMTQAIETEQRRHLEQLLEKAARWRRQL